MTIQIRGDTAANWTATNPTPAPKQPCWESDTNKLKIGDGATAWASLPYFAAGGGGSFAYTVTAHAVSYTETATSGYNVIKITASGQTVTLPTAVGNTGLFVVKLMVAGTVVVDGNASETIDGGLTATLTTQYESITFVSDNSNWIII